MSSPAIFLPPAVVPEHVAYHSQVQVHTNYYITHLGNLNVGALAGAATPLHNHPIVPTRLSFASKMAFSKSRPCPSGVCRDSSSLSIVLWVDPTAKEMCSKVATGPITLLAFEPEEQISQRSAIES